MSAKLPKPIVCTKGIIMIKQMGTSFWAACLVMLLVACSDSPVASHRQPDARPSNLSASGLSKAPRDLKVPTEIPSAQELGFESEEPFYLEFEKRITAADRANWRTLGAFETYYFHSSYGVLLKAAKQGNVRNALADLPRVVYATSGAYGEKTSSGGSLMPVSGEASSWTGAGEPFGHGFHLISSSQQFSNVVVIGVVDDGVSAPYDDIPVGAFGAGWSINPVDAPYAPFLSHGTKLASAAIGRITGTLVRGAAPQFDIGIAAYRALAVFDNAPNCLSYAAGVDQASMVNFRPVIVFGAVWPPSEESSCLPMVSALISATSPGIGAVVVVPAGNKTNNCSQNGTVVCFPANKPEALAVSGLEQKLVRLQLVPRFWDDGAQGSTQGSEVDISAGAKEIMASCHNSLLCPPGRVVAENGTSAATAQVAAAAALVMAKWPDSYRKGDVVRQHLLDTAYPPPFGGVLNPDLYGAGILNAKAAFDSDPCVVYDCSGEVIGGGE